jgi:hypothetical protein
MRRRLRFRAQHAGHAHTAFAASQRLSRAPGRAQERAGSAPAARLRQAGVLPGAARATSAQQRNKPQPCTCVAAAARAACARAAARAAARGCALLAPRLRPGSEDAAETDGCCTTAPQTGGTGLDRPRACGARRRMRVQPCAAHTSGCAARDGAGATAGCSRDGSCSRRVKLRQRSSDTDARKHHDHPCPRGAKCDALDTQHTRAAHPPLRARAPSPRDAPCGTQRAPT